MPLANLIPSPLTYADLRSSGLTRRQVGRLVTEGRLTRVRRGRYLPLPAHEQVIEAARLGGRLDCVSLLEALGVFVLSSKRLHFAVAPGSSRLPAPPPGSIRHWPAATADRSVVVEALARAVRCQPVAAAIATLDSAWHQGLVGETELDADISMLPARYRVLRGMLDRRCESGPESLVRLMLRRIGCDFTPQVSLRGVGRVDFVVDGWLVVECDSREFHSAWEQQRRDYRRTLAAARQGYVTVRITAEDILYRPDEVLQALRGVISSRRSGRRRGRNSSLSTFAGRGGAGSGRW